MRAPGGPVMKTPGGPESEGETTVLPEGELEAGEEGVEGGRVGLRRGGVAVGPEGERPDLVRELEDGRPHGRLALPHRLGPREDDGARAGRRQLDDRAGRRGVDLETRPLVLGLLVEPDAGAVAVLDLDRRVRA